MNNIIEYQTGAHAADEWEVMRESTANLYAESNFKARVESVEKDIAMFEYDNLIKMIDDINNPKAPLPSYHSYCIEKYGYIPA